MNNKILSKLFYIFAFFCFLLLIQTGEEKSNSNQPLNITTSEQNNLQNSFPDFYHAYQDAITSTTPELQLIAINKALAIASKQDISSPKAIKSLHLLAADIHQERWHINYAINSLLNSQSIVFDKVTDNRIKHLRKHLSQSQSERAFNDTYVATRATGPAKSLQGKVLVAYVFIDDGIKTRWSGKSKLRSQQVLQQVEQWQKARAADYQITELEFINKTFIVQRNPKLKAFSGISYKSQAKDIDKFVNMIMHDLGSSDVGSFIQDQMKQENAEQGVVIFHSNIDKRSFATRCGYTHVRTYYKNGEKKQEMLSDCNREFVMLTEQVKHNRWDKLQYVQAHEMLHVFGADDLYRIKNAAEYALTDIMNFQSRYLNHSDIHPVTAYAIGWQKTQPKAPFKILDR
jgi:hypothetical protein